MEQNCDDDLNWTFRLRGEISDVEVIAVGRAIRILSKLQKAYGKGRWRKLRMALVELPDGSIERAELHWYEAHGTGRRDIKFKTLLD